MSSTQHLIQREGRWYYHRRVPKAVQNHLGSVIKQALGTSNRTEAIKRREVLDVQWSARIEALLANDDTTGPAPQATFDADVEPLSSPTAILLVQEYVKRVDQSLRRRWQTRPPADRQEKQDAIETAEIDLAVSAGTCDRYNHEEAVWLTTDEIAKRANVDVPVGTPATAEFFHLVRRAMVEVSRRAVARARDDHGSAFYDVLFSPEAPKPQTVAQLADQFLRYSEEEATAHSRSAKHVDKVRASVGLVVKLLGPGTAVHEVGYDRCREACSKLARLPPNHTKLYGNAAIDDVLKRAEVEARPPLSFLSQQQYLGTLRQLLDLAVSKGLLRTNPSSTLRPLSVDRVPASKKRIPFEPEQLKTFFHSSFYETCGAHPEAPFLGADKDWRFWMPLLCLFMGMRPKEVCQLHVTDLQRTALGAWFISVEPTEDDNDSASKSTKTKTSRRSVPLHGELRHIGFVEYVAAQVRASDDKRLFRSITRNKYGDPAHYPLRRFHEAFLPEAMQLKPRQTFYSFRHTWRDAVRAINAPDDFLQAVGGWSKGMTTSDNYGSLKDVDRYAAYMDRIEFPGVGFDHLRPRR